MSKHLDAAERALDVGVQSSEISYVPYDNRNLCWRCQTNPPRVPDTDFTCEPCFAYLTEETDVDPKPKYARYDLAQELDNQLESWESVWDFVHAPETIS